MIASGEKSDLGKVTGIGILITRLFSVGRYKLSRLECLRFLGLFLFWKIGHQCKNQNESFFPNGYVAI
ncbi:hypothetical protein D0X99_16600 [Algoriphagus lacus]|uniref:Uncharacterized protein n=1 Tax=Algoriphagus lacus TaxID=2056311 RepID=A0A418PNC7_9BACT|nr:hypothetical protein D0X99_16600 [Algoriphagus lacus]